MPYAAVVDRFATPEAPDQLPPTDEAIATVEKVLRWKNYPFIDQPGPLEFVRANKGEAEVFANAATGEKLLSFKLVVVTGQWAIENFQVCAAPMGQQR